jgi:hypothetical protein
VAASLAQLLRRNVLTELISRQLSAEHWILQFLGMQPGGFNEIDHGHGRRGSYRVFNNTREIAKGRFPGTAAGSSPRNPLGEVGFNYLRMHDSITLPDEETFQFSRMDEEGVADGGAQYIAEQTRFLSEKAANFRVAAAVGMLRDQLYQHVVGDDIYYDFTSTGNQALQIPFQMPDDNQNQLDNAMGSDSTQGDIIDTSWDNTSADIPSHVGQIDAAFQAVYGGRLENILLQNSMWQNVINNDKVATQSGIANVPFRRYERVAGTREDGSPFNVRVGELTNIPGVTWWITDEGLNLGAPGSEAFVKYVPDNTAIFMGNPRQKSNFKMMISGERIAERPGGPKMVKRGFSAWSYSSFNPTAEVLFVLDNLLAINGIPNSVARGTVVF